MVPIRIALAAVVFASASGSAGAAGPTDDEIIMMTTIKWAGLNCGKLIPSEHFQSAMKFTNELDDETAASALRRVRATMDKAASREVACQAVVDAL